MKSVLFLIPTLGGGGAEKVLVNLVNFMDRTKYDITVQTLFQAGVNKAFLHKDIKLIEGRIKQFSGNVALMKLFSPSQLYRYFVGKHYDVVVSYLEGPTARILSGCPHPDTKKVSWIHVEHLNAKQTYYSFRSRSEAEHCYSSFNANVYVSRDVMTNFTEFYPFLQNNYVIYNTNNDDYIIRKANESVTEVALSDNLNVISVGRLTPVKGFDRLIDAHHRLIQEGIKHHLYILGKGELQSSLEEQLHRNGDESTVHLLGFNPNPYKFMAKADLFVCSSWREGFSTAVTEALILGIPVVTTKVSGAFEQMGENNEYGIVTDNNTNALYNGLKQVLCDPQLLRHYKGQAIERGKLFSRDNCVKSVENLIDSLF